MEGEPNATILRLEGNICLQIFGVCLAPVFPYPVQLLILGMGLVRMVSWFRTQERLKTLQSLHAILQPWFPSLKYLELGDTYLYAWISWFVWNWGVRAAPTFQPLWTDDGRLFFSFLDSSSSFDDDDRLPLLYEEIVACALLWSLGMCWKPRLEKAQIRLEMLWVELMVSIVLFWYQYPYLSVMCVLLATRWTMGFVTGYYTYSFQWAFSWQEIVGWTFAQPCTMHISFWACLLTFLRVVDESNPFPFSFSHVLTLLQVVGVIFLDAHVWIPAWVFECCLLFVR